MSPQTATWRSPTRKSGRPRQTRRIPERTATRELGETLQQGLNRIVDEALPHVGEAFPELWEQLTPHGRRQLLLELLEAVVKDDGLDETTQVVEAWYHTMIARQSPTFEQALERSGRTPDELGEKAYTIEELRDILSG
jgi:hypothetical protein